jgi:hypothetical protein
LPRCRCETLIRLIEKENEDMKEETDKGTRGRGGGGGGRGGGRGGRGGGAAGAEGAGTGRKRKSTAAGASAAVTPAMGGTPQPGSEDGSPQPPDRKKGRA